MPNRLSRVVASSCSSVLSSFLPITYFLLLSPLIFRRDDDLDMEWNYREEGEEK
jgi:hypothetical protein